MTFDPSNNARPALTAELETAIIRELLANWRQVNDAHFDAALKTPLLDLFDGGPRLGVWEPRKRTLRLSRTLISEQPWAVVIEVLKHEMAHQFVHEVLGHYDEAPHGTSFKSVCARLGIDPAAAGTPKDAGDPEVPASEARILQKIAKLLALAESSNQNESESAMAAARRLMLKYNLETAGPSQNYSFRQLGRVTGRISEAERRVSVLLSEHFFVEAIWVYTFLPLENRRGRVLEVCGSKANLDFAEYVHGFLHHCAERLWLEHQHRAHLRSNRDRAMFMGGVISGFSEKLAAEKNKNVEEGLIWVGDTDLHKYYRARHRHIRSMTHAGKRGSEAHAHGRKAGRQIVLHRPLAPSSTPSGAPKLLVGGA